MPTIARYRGYNIHVRQEYAFIYWRGELVDTIRHGTYEQAKRLVDDWLHAP